MDNENEQSDEIVALQSIYNENIFDCDISRKPFSGRMTVGLRNCSGPYDFKCNDATVQIDFISPIVVNFVMPPGYPSSEPPTIELQCLWLSPEHIEMLKERLYHLWEENYRCVVLFTWIDFLQNEGFGFLNLEFPLAVSETALEQLLKVSRKLKDKSFRAKSHYCDVCSQIKKGVNLVKFETCGHLVCRECGHSHIEDILNKRQIDKVICNVENCEDKLTVCDIKDISEELFEKYTEITTQQEYELQFNIRYCPSVACGMAISVEEDATCVICPGCSFAFCPNCKMTYHGVNKCKKPMKKMVGRLANEEKETAKEEIVVLCPNCSSRADKDGGINKIVCYCCKCIYCYLCQSQLVPKDVLDHYKDEDNPTCFNKYSDSGQFPVVKTKEDKKPPVKKKKKKKKDKEGEE